MKKLWSIFEKIIYTILSFLFSLFGRELSASVFNGFMQFVKFGLVGVSNTVISYLLYSISLLTFRHFKIFQNTDYLIAQLVAFVLSVLWSYTLNSILVFKVDEGKVRSPFKTLIKTYISYSFTGLFLNTVLLYLWVDMLGINEFIAPFINMIISVPINFLINKFWAFKSA